MTIFLIELLMLFYVMKTKYLYLHNISHNLMVDLPKDCFNYI